MDDGVVCGRAHHARGMCIMHYHRSRRVVKTHPAFPADRKGERLCSKCGEWKTLDRFTFEDRKGRLSRRCKDCARLHEAARRSPERDRASRLRRNYGMSVEEFTALSEAQGNACSICYDVPDLLRVDHDHETGAVRGLLCDSCNKGLGFFRDNPARLTAALTYLK